MQLLAPRSGFVVAIVSLLVASTAARAADEAYQLDCPPDKVCRDPATLLPARVLTRPFSNVYKTEDDGVGNILVESIRAFSPLYVFERKDIDFADPADPKGWYEVGETVNGVPLGWMQARDVVEWRQALIVAFTHPGVDDKRQPVLLFESLEPLRAITEADARQAETKELYGELDQTLANGSEPPAGVVSMEPTRFVDIRETFYMLPVLQFEELNLFDEDARYLQVVAVTKDRAAPGDADTLENRDFREQAAQSPSALFDASGDLSVDIVFVMDMTASMGPFIDRVKDAMTDMVRVINQENVADRVSFGLVGYRDNTSLMPQLEFTAKNFTPELLSADQFVNLLGSVNETSVSSQDYAEEVFAGLGEALNTAWSEPSLRFMILVGDASAHPPGHPQNTTHLDAPTLRQRLTDSKVNLLSLHLLEGRAADDHPIARQQYALLATNPGLEAPVYIPIEVEDQDAYLRAVKKVSENFTQILGYLAGGNVSQLQREAEEASAQVATATDAVQMADLGSKALGYAALVPYLGKDATPPRDITAWVVDRDLERPELRSLDVRVLLTRQQLNDLVIAIEQVLQALKRAKVTQMAFFEALQGIATETSKGEKIDYDSAVDLKAAGLLDDWVASLPYKSDILSMSDAYYASLSPDERASLEFSLEAKLEAYQELLKSDDWIALNPNDATQDQIFPVQLAQLP